MNFIWSHFVDPEGDTGSRPGSERDAAAEGGDLESVTIVEVALTNCL